MTTPLFYIDMALQYIVKYEIQRRLRPFTFITFSKTFRPFIAFIALIAIVYYLRNCHTTSWTNDTTSPPDVHSPSCPCLALWDFSPNSANLESISKWERHHPADGLYKFPCWSKTTKKKSISRQHWSSWYTSVCKMSASWSKKNMHELVRMSPITKATFKTRKPKWCFNREVLYLFVVKNKRFSEYVVQELPYLKTDVHHNALHCDYQWNGSISLILSDMKKWNLCRNDDGATQ